MSNLGFDLIMCDQVSLDDEIINRALSILESRIINKGVTIVGSDSAVNFLRLQLELEEQEIFCVLFMDTQNRVIEFKKMFFGTLSETSVYPREVVKLALKLNASSVIFSHNHPSGIPEPSIEDRHITKRLSDALNLVDVRILDHIVIGHGISVSFAERGWLPF